MERWNESNAPTEHAYGCPPSPARVQDKRPLNSPEIISGNSEEFSIDMNRMDLMKPYLMTLKDARYMIWKNQDGALVIVEV